MSGHSKWSTIKHKKAALDAKRGKVFTKVVKEITVAARLGGGDPATNARLRLLIDKAKAANMPGENIIRAIKKGTGELPGVAYEAHTYEGYGPYNIAIIVEVLTDNKNRSVAELRRAFTLAGGSLAETGAVNWMFSKLGVIRGTTQLLEDQLLEKLLEYDIHTLSIDPEDQSVIITGNPKQLDTIRHAAHTAGVTVSDAEFEWVAPQKISLDPENEKKAYSFLEELEELEDVQNIYTNLD